MLEEAYISYNTGTRALPDIYALALGRCVPLGIMHIYQAMHSCLCYNLCIYIYVFMYILHTCIPLVYTCNAYISCLFYYQVYIQQKKII